MNYNTRYTQHQGKPYAGIPQPSECSAGKDVTLLFYLDDICIFACSIDEMLDRIGLVLHDYMILTLK